MGLKIVGLPLGNIEDISLRAVKTLSQAGVVICEDTRVFHKLWQKVQNIGQLEKPFEGRLLILNEFNEKDKAIELAEQIKSYGEEVVLVSDAGLPLVSDPGFRLVNNLVDL